MNPPTVYVAWIEDENGHNLQNLYVCNTEVGIGKTLTGDALPNWRKIKQPEHADIVGVTGPSAQQVICFARDIGFDTSVHTRFRVCLEIDRSLNSNAYFSNDRPAFQYQTDLIDLSALQGSYPIRLAGWMSNDTTGGYGQQPNTPIPSYSPYAYMTDTTWIAPTNDMVTAGQIKVVHN